MIHRFGYHGPYVCEYEYLATSHCNKRGQYYRNRYGLIIALCHSHMLDTISDGYVLLTDEEALCHLVLSN